MKIRLEHSGTVFELEREPLPEGRFRAILGLAAAGVYAGMVVTVAALCGLYGVITVGVVTVLVVLSRAMAF